MPPYFFHLAFELYPRAPDFSQPVQLPGASVPFEPQRNLDIFSANLPTHSASTWTSFLAPKKPSRRTKSSGGSYGLTRSSLNSVIGRPSSRAADDIAITREGAHSEISRTRNEYTSKQAVGKCARRDWRFDTVAIQSIDLKETSATEQANMESPLDLQAGTEAGVGGLALRGRYIPSNPKTTDFGCGVVHLYRDTVPSAKLADVTWAEDDAISSSDTNLGHKEAYIDEDCTTLCILAVPSYMTPSDLLGWLGEETMEKASHLRLVKTGRSNRYMVLMKFRKVKDAKDWQKLWNGKLFNSMEPENCHVVFVKSIRFQMSDSKKDPSSFPDMSNDPFTPSVTPSYMSKRASTLTPNSDTSPRPTASLSSSKPAPPPTPSLVELPTCPVCLERMDETSGLATIFCQHVFHCACLQKWRGSGCPVCRHTQDEPMSRGKIADDEHSECSACGSNSNLWICLICGNVGCGRYDEAHAFAHYEQTSHTFAMDIATQHIWDYDGDEYVHRLIQNKSDGKLVELPSSAAGQRGSLDQDMIPRDKMENMSLEYTYLLTSQLDSQRMYFEGQVERAVDKAAKAAAAAEKASETTLKTQQRLESLESSHEILTRETLPTLERGKERAERRAEKFETMARSMEKEYREKKVINESLMDRISYLEKQVNDAILKSSDLEEQNRDLSFFISGMEKLKNQGEEVQEGTLMVADPPQIGKKKGKKKKTPAGPAA